MVSLYTVPMIVTLSVSLATLPEITYDNMVLCVDAWLGGGIGCSVAIVSHNTSHFCAITLVTDNMVGRVVKVEVHIP